MTLNLNLVCQIKRQLSDGRSVRWIADNLHVSRQAVRRIRDGTPRRSKKRSVHLEMDQKKDLIKRLFFKHRQNCVVLLDHMSEIMDQEVQLRLLQIFCRPFRREVELEKNAREKRFEKGPGVQMQIDFGEDTLTVSGVENKVHFIVAKMSYSRRIFVKAYPAENQDTWLDGIESAIRYFDGIPREIVSDNSRCLVKKPGAPLEDRFTDRYLYLCNHYGINPVTASVGNPKSKGKVEAGVKYIKINAFADRHRFEDFEDINDHLQKWMAKSDRRYLGDPVIEGYRTPAERWIVEQPELGRINNRLQIDHIDVFSRIVDKYGLIRVDNCHYKVSIDLAGEKVQVISSKNHLSICKPGMETITIEKAEALYTPSYQPRSIRPDRETEYQQIMTRNQADENWRKMQNPEVQRSTSEYDWIMEECRQCLN